jgi:beta-lactamase regulating signal transducer with metallopeptidase domain
MIGVSESILNYVVNASWQIAAIVLVAAFASFVLRNGPARYRHLLWIAALALSTIVPLLGVPRANPVEKSVLTVSPAPATVSAEVNESENPLSRLTTRRARVISASLFTTVWLMVGYMLLLAWRVIRLGRFWVKKERLRRAAISHGLASGVAHVAQRCRAILKTRDVLVTSSPSSSVPCTIGLRRPLIVLPEKFCVANDEHLLSVIGHEMAHVARHDYLTNLICEIILLPISFHPLALLIKRQIDHERELACDELVSKRLLPPKIYARSIVWAADLSSHARRQALTLSMFDARNLEERIMRLTRNRRMLSARVARTVASLAMVVLCAVTVSLSLFSFELRTQARAALKQTLPRFETTIATSSTTVTDLTPQTRAEERSPAAPSAQARAEAACDAERRGDVAKVPTLIAMLGDDTKTEPLRCWDTGRWTPALETFKHPSPGEQAAIALASMGHPAFVPLSNQLTHSNATVRRNAAWAIGELHNMPPGERDDAVPQLVTLLNDSDEWVRMAAARALGELRNETAVPKLIATLSDSEWHVRELAVWALSELKDARAVTALCSVMLSDTRVEVRRGAAEALGEIASPEALPSLKQALNDPDVSSKAQWAINEIEG